MTLLICLAICAGLFIYSYLSQKKQKDKHERDFAAALPGTVIATIGGLRGTVVRRGENSLIVDFSPDQSGSLIELEKDGFAEIAGKEDKA